MSTLTWVTCVLARRVEQGIVKPAVCVDAEEFHVDNDVLSHGIYKIKVVGDVLAGRVERTWQ